MTPKLVERLLAGENIALVTNAGTPGISDPGYSLTHAAVQADIAVTSIPGASAVITALTLADLPLHSFTFKGFPPHKEGPRKRFLEQEKHSAHTLAFYESPYRLIAFLKNALEIYGDRRAVLANDLTKKFETIWRGSLSEILSGVEARPIKGEFCICIEGCGEEKPKTKEG